MEKRRFGKTEMEFSVLGFGGSEIGWNNESVTKVEQILNSAFDAGLNVVDTAAAYRTSEQLIGAALGKRRKEIHLLTKCGALDAFEREDWSKKGIIETIEQSLRNLRTDYLDIAQLHSCSLEILRRDEPIEALLRAQEKGHTRYIGYSGDNEAARYVIGLGVFDSLQISVSVADQTAIDDIVPLAAESGMGVIAKRSIANAVWRHSELPPDPYHHEYWERVRKLKYGFLEKSVEVATATALRFTFSVPGVSTLLVGTTNPDRINENAKYIAEGKLSAEEFESIRDRWREVAEEDWVGLT
jgi:aryl-alcohol dehydrogenase-like predicted oxidoreductase